ncbi:MAG: hypothetical protein NT129_00860 [Candidatus Aenigmarchaeota archaeon]|nr:hypothetical protein [Candidatus Aenigmarchaeota archaeon]
MKKLIGIATLALALLATAVFAADGGSPSIAANANVYCNVDADCATGYTCQNYACVLKTCGITASALDFSYIVPGTTKGSDGSIYSTVANGGNTPTTSLDIWGTAWVGLNPANTMPVGQTSWYYAGNWYQLSGSWQGTGFSVSPGSTNIAFELAVPAGQATDTYAQTITFMAGC